MKIYKTRQGIVIENDAKFYLVQDENWDEFINDDNLSEKAKKITENASPGGSE